MAVNIESAKKDTLVIYSDNAGEWRWTRTATNGNIVGASTEGYINKSDCVDNANRQFVECTIKED